MGICLRNSPAFEESKRIGRDAGKLTSCLAFSFSVPRGPARRGVQLRPCPGRGLVPAAGGELLRPLGGVGLCTAFKDRKGRKRWGLGLMTAASRPAPRPCPGHDLDGGSAGAASLVRAREPRHPSGPPCGGCWGLRGVWPLFVAPGLGDPGAHG